MPHMMTNSNFDVLFLYSTPLKAPQENTIGSIRSPLKAPQEDTIGSMRSLLKAPQEHTIGSMRSLLQAPEEYTNTGLEVKKELASFYQRGLMERKYT